jgi:CheY-like chemotaxis protein
VDDSLTIRTALEIVLKPAGYELELAADGAEAIAKAKALKPDLVLLDFILPDMRGTDVCRQLASDPQTAAIPVVLISAKGAEIEQAYRDVGNVVSYVAKPFTPPTITSVVAEVLAKAANGQLVKIGSFEQPVAADGSPSGDSAGAHALSDAEPYPSLGAGEEQQIPDADLDEVEGTAAVQLPADGTGIAAAIRDQRLESAFEILRSGLEGVYVEEIDTPAGATADQAKSYIDLLGQLSRELDEGLQHACSGVRYHLYRDGAMRAFDETLLDVFRRSCRLLFRAAVAGIVDSEPVPSGRRVLVICHKNSRVHGQLQSWVSAHPEWHVIAVTDNFRQLPLLTRLYGPTDIIAEVTWSGALWDQLRTLRRLPETRTTATIVGIVDPDALARHADMDPAARAAALAERGVSRVFASAMELEAELLEGPSTVASLGSVSEAGRERLAI